MAMNPSGEQFYSAGLDSLISVWNLPNLEVDPYDPYGRTSMLLLFFFFNLRPRLDSNVLSKVLQGHTDAVWQLVLADQKLLSASADGSVRLWDPNLPVPLQSTYHSRSLLSPFI